MSSKKGSQMLKNAQGHLRSFSTVNNSQAKTVFKKRHKSVFVSSLSTSQNLRNSNEYLGAQAENLDKTLAHMADRARPSRLTLEQKRITEV
jgi:hypothetical protein